LTLKKRISKRSCLSCFYNAILFRGGGGRIGSGGLVTRKKTTRRLCFYSNQPSKGRAPNSYKRLVGTSKREVTTKTRGPLKIMGLLAERNETLAPQWGRPGV